MATFHTTKLFKPSPGYSSYWICCIISWFSTQQIPNKQTYITALILVHYSASATCFGPAGYSSGSLLDVQLTCY
jgi:hypothetical protein